MNSQILTSLAFRGGAISQEPAFQFVLLMLAFFLFVCGNAEGFRLVWVGFLPSCYTVHAVKYIKKRYTVKPLFRNSMGSVTCHIFGYLLLFCFFLRDSVILYSVYHYVLCDLMR